MVSRLVRVQEAAGSNPATPTMQKPSTIVDGFLQLNPPYRVGEIIFDGEIPCGGEIRLDAGRVDLISSEAKPKISPVSADFTLAQARISLYGLENIYSL